MDLSDGANLIKLELKLGKGLRNASELNAGQVVIISVIEAKASRARGHSGHEAPPMTHSLVLTPPL